MSTEVQSQQVREVVKAPEAQKGLVERKGVLGFWDRAKKALSGGEELRKRANESFDEAYRQSPDVRITRGVYDAAYIVGNRAAAAFDVLGGAIKRIMSGNSEVNDRGNLAYEDYRQQNPNARLTRSEFRMAYGAGWKVAEGADKVAKAGEKAVETVKVRGEKVMDDLKETPVGAKIVEIGQRLEARGKERDVIALKKVVGDMSSRRAEIREMRDSGELTHREAAKMIHEIWPEEKKLRAERRELRVEAKSIRKGIEEKKKARDLISRIGRAVKTATDEGKK